MSSVPKRYYRYGIAPEKALIDEVSKGSDGVVLPAHLVADQRSSIVPWLRGKSFYIDPMTHVWFLKSCNLVDKKGNFRRAFNRLRDGPYGPLFSNITEPRQKINPSDLFDDAGKPVNNLKTSIQSIINFQVNFIQEVAKDEEIAEYEAILKQLSDDYVIKPGWEPSADVRPDRIVLPYIYFPSEKSIEYQANKLIWDEASITYEDDLPLFAMIATGYHAMDWSRIAADLKGKVDGVIIWFSDLDEVTAPPKQLIELRKGCKILSKEGFRVVIHAGGAFAMGLGDDGVELVSGGITYGDKRGVDLVEGGPVPQRYYVPQLVRPFTVADAIMAVEALGMDCTNECCAHCQGDVSSLVNIFFPGDEPPYGPVAETKRHYLYRFKQQMDEIWSNGRESGIEWLEASKNKAEETLFPKLWQHLDNWIEAYKEQI